MIALRILEMDLEYFAVEVPLPRRSEGMKSLLDKLFRMEKRKCSSLTYIFCSDKYLLAINRQFLKHDYYTDIITFDLSSDKKSVIGEIYISTQRVRANAKELKLPIKDELLRVMIHGALHLCGYKDKSKTDKLAMRSREDYYIRKSKQAE